MAQTIGNPMTLTLTSDREISITRVLDAPRTLVWEACHQCEHLAHWWGPRGYELIECSVDLRPGGGYRFVQRALDGSIHPFHGSYREIQKPERVVFTQVYEPIPDAELVVTTTLTEVDGKTAMTQHMLFPSKEARDGMIATGMEWGQRQSFERLDEVLAELYQRQVAGPELEISREFDAPRELVWKAWTDRQALAAWWGAAGTTITVKAFDLRPGGLFLYSMTSPNGPDIWARFTYREVSPIERLVFINSFSDEAGGMGTNPWMPGWPLEIVSILTLEDLGGRTKLTIHGAPINATAAERTAFEGGRAGMKGGFEGTFRKLDSYLEGLKAAAGR
jgi:uncharacterized protein YndB with AHSA1/START domain